MPEESFEDKTEKPTPRKREEVRKKGQVAKSREIPSVLVLISGIMVLCLFNGYLNNYFNGIFCKTLSLPDFNDMNREEFIIFGKDIIGGFIVSLLPFFMVVFIVGIFSNVLQVGFMFSTELVTPKLSKINPIKGFKRLFSKNLLIELFKSILKLIIVGFIAFRIVNNELDSLPELSQHHVSIIIGFILWTIFKIFIWTLLAMLVIAILDYGFHKWQFEKDIMMTRKELKDDLKMTEGDPLIKSRIRSIQMQMAMKRMMQEVPKADVVITNPTHIAIALRYDSFTMDAPMVVAKGAGAVAEKIKEIANKYDIPIIENKELAGSLYKIVEVGEQIPPLLYHAVAEILAYVYRLKGKSIHEGRV